MSQRSGLYLECALWKTVAGNKMSINWLFVNDFRRRLSHVWNGCKTSAKVNLAQHRALVNTRPVSLWTATRLFAICSVSGHCSRFSNQGAVASCCMSNCSQIKTPISASTSSPKQEKCAQYWPTAEETEMAFRDTCFLVTVLSEDVKSYYTTRVLELQNISVGQKKRSRRFCRDQLSSVVSYRDVIRETPRWCFCPKFKLKVGDVCLFQRLIF